MPDSRSSREYSLCINALPEITVEIQNVPDNFVIHHLQKYDKPHL